MIIAVVVAVASSVCLAYFYYLSRHVRWLGEHVPAAPALPPGTAWPRVSVITAFRGIDAVLEANLRAFFDQDYPAFEYLLAVPSTSDAAYPVLRAMAEAHPGRACVCVAEGFSRERADKLNNMLAALAHANPQSEVFVFYNADGQIRPDFLRALVAPLAAGRAQVTTSCRWMEPLGGTLTEWLNTLWGDIVMGLQVHPRHTLPWGGAMALKRDLFERLKVADLWGGSLTDDNALGQLLKSHGVPTAFAARAFVVEPAMTNWRGFMAFGRRQLFFLRVTIPLDWAGGAFAMTSLGPAPLGLALWLAWSAWAGAWDVGKAALAVVTAIFLIGILLTVRNFERGVEQLLIGLGFNIVRLPGPALLLASPATVIMWLQVVASGIGRRIKWGPIVYEAIGLSKTRVVKVES
jgi:cellulose synthase/poly-beta-1,6-N-acetylglucosamine synthase-like glycosyltransferase